MSVTRPHISISNDNNKYSTQSERVPDCRNILPGSVIFANPGTRTGTRVVAARTGAFTEAAKNHPMHFEKEALVK